MSGDQHRSGVPEERGRKLLDHLGEDRIVDCWNDEADSAAGLRAESTGSVWHVTQLVDHQRDPVARGFFYFPGGIEVA